MFYPADYLVLMRTNVVVRRHAGLVSVFYTVGIWKPSPTATHQLIVFNRQKRSDNGLFFTLGACACIIPLGCAGILICLGYVFVFTIASTSVGVH